MTAHKNRLDQETRRRLNLMSWPQFIQLLEQLGLDRDEFSPHSTPAERGRKLEDQLEVERKWRDFWNYADTKWPNDSLSEERIGNIEPCITILHLTDLHMGGKNRFQGQDFAQLGKLFAEEVLQAKTQTGLQEDSIDLILVTGDIAETGQITEFRSGATFLIAVTEHLKLPRGRVLFVPGNHDISWPLCQEVAEQQKIEGFNDNELNRRLAAVKLQNYETFRRDFYGTELTSMPGYRGLSRGAEIWDLQEKTLTIGAVNACERESHVATDRLGTVGPGPAQELMDAWGGPRYEKWMKILMVHHNPSQSVEANHLSWVKWIQSENQLPADLVERFMADITGFPGKEFLEKISADRKVQILLHGHHHAHPESPICWYHSSGLHSTLVLSTGSWGLGDKELPTGETNTWQILQILPNEKQNLHRFVLRYDPRLPVNGKVEKGGWRLDGTEQKFQVGMPDFSSP